MGTLTPYDFMVRWRASRLSERASAQSHFLDLCEMLDEPKPHELDPEGTWYTFEKGAARTGHATSGWADVWKRHHFAWEYKGKHQSLDAAFAQLQRYAIALENPPLLIVSDMETIRIHTNFTNSVQQIHSVTLEDLKEPKKVQLLKRVFAEPESLRPGETRQGITEKAAATFGALAQALRKRTDDAGELYDPQRVAHFINKLVFCMFAEDIGLLPERLFSKMVYQ
ncbi:MAG: class I SAM-dependent DNA methyltransferase, partial [Alphaproteobacteria bacterium]|nr:class I SAM-dependent DNA methyltransferase [Alphaproteobacteria bacterium]